MTKHFTVVYQFNDDEELKEWFRKNIATNLCPNDGNVMSYSRGDVIEKSLELKEKTNVQNN